MNPEHREMHIGFIVVKNLLRGGGIESLTYEVGKRLVSRGHKVTVFSMGHYGEVPAMAEGMTVVSVPCLPGAATERVSASISAILAAIVHRPKITILHLHTPMTGAFGAIAQVFGIPAVVQLHGVDWKRSRWGFMGRTVIRALESFVMRTSPSCTAVSKTQCDFYESQYKRRITFIPTGTHIPQKNQDTDEIERLGLKKGEFILFASRLVPEKGAHYLISAFSKIKTNFKLVIAGGDVSAGSYPGTLKKLAGEDPRVIFPGFVEGRLKVQLLNHASIYVLPSEIEGLSISLLEAMSCGRACLASDIPENIEAMGEAGSTFRSGNVDDLRRKLEELITRKEIRDQLGNTARLRSLTMYSWDNVTDALLKLYRESM